MRPAKRHPQQPEQADAEPASTRPAEAREQPPEPASAKNPPSPGEARALQEELARWAEGAADRNSRQRSIPIIGRIAIIVSLSVACWLLLIALILLF